MTDLPQDMKAFNRNVINAYRESNGVGSLGPLDFARLLLLTTRGARSGRSHTVPLGFVPFGEEAVVFANTRGKSGPPQWFDNLSADPNVTVEMHGRVFDATVRVLRGPERDAGIAAGVAAFPGAADQENREFPVVAVPLP